MVVVRHRRDRRAPSTMLGSEGQYHTRRVHSFSCISLVISVVCTPGTRRLRYAADGHSSPVGRCNLSNRGRLNRICPISANCLDFSITTCTIPKHCIKSNRLSRAHQFVSNARETELFGALIDILKGHAIHIYTSIFPYLTLTYSHKSSPAD